MPLQRALRFHSLVFALAALAISGTRVMAASMDVQLTFGTLPSAQGWTYTPSGAHAGVLEANIFSVAGSALHQNSMGQSNGVAGGSILYVLSGGVTTSETKELLVRARCTQAEGSANATQGQGGYIFGFSTGASQYAFGLTPTKLTVLIPSGTFVFATNYDNTQYHDYRFAWAPAASGTYSLYRDGVFINTSSGGFPVAANRIFLGDGTGGANAAGDVSQFRFLQGGATDSRTSSWGRMKRLYH